VNPLLNWIHGPWRRPATPAPSPGNLDIAKLLGRPVVSLDTPTLQRFLAGKRVLVTGAGGSIGSEICRQTMRFLPQRMLLLERSENNLFEIDRALREAWLGAEIRPLLADICDRETVEKIFAEQQPQVVFHCAAHKHVPMMEHNPAEAIRNNVFGTKTVADAAAAADAAAFVMVSTDKAVNPSSVMGATKRVAEQYVQSLESETRFAAVRFGNVLGSSGSVVPIFQKQIAAGGPVTVTHPQMKRYFMTIPEASQLVMQAGAIGNGSEIFVLDMGEPVEILELARRLIRAHGLREGEDIAIEFTGIRPGEKLFEELAGDAERTAPTSHESIRVWSVPRPSGEQMQTNLKLLAHAARTGPAEAVAALHLCVPEYRNGDRAEATPARPALRLVPSEAAAA
jgi:FlaA1/EpsC-like NDP-sugar epimerase